MLSTQVINFIFRYFISAIHISTSIQLNYNLIYYQSKKKSMSLKQQKTE